MDASSQDPTSPSSDGSGGADGRRVLPEVPEPKEPKPDGTCDADRKKCGDACVSLLDSTYGCMTSSCAPCSIPHGAAVCRDGACEIGACENNRADCNNNPTDGCETDLSSGPTSCEACQPACGDGFVCTNGTCAPSCKLETFYEDDDLDGWGGSKSVQACAAPPGYTGKTGDCQDGNPHVFPHQQGHFGTAYTTMNGASSFDYDCDGLESPDPGAFASDIRECFEGEACDRATNTDTCWVGSSSRPFNCGRGRTTCTHPFGWISAGPLACR